MKKLKKILFFIAMSISFVSSCSFVSATKVSNPTTEGSKSTTEGSKSTTSEGQPITEQKIEDLSKIKKLEPKEEKKEGEPIPQSEEGKNINKEAERKRQISQEKQSGEDLKKSVENLKNQIEEKTNIEQKEEIIKQKFEEVDKKLEQKQKEESVIEEQKSVIKKEKFAIEEKGREQNKKILNTLDDIKVGILKKSETSTSIAINFKENEKNDESINFYLNPNDEKIYFNYDLLGNTERGEKKLLNDDKTLVELYQKLSKAITESKEDEITINLSKEADMNKYKDIYDFVQQIRKHLLEKKQLNK